MNNFSSLKKKLAAYSAMAGTIFAYSKESEGQIIYHDIDPDGISIPAGYYLDLNNDGVSDFKFYRVEQGASCPSNYFKVQAYNNNLMLVDSSSYPVPLNYSDAIPPIACSTCNWIQGNEFLASYFCLTGSSSAGSCFACAWHGPWQNYLDYYLAIKLMDSAGYHYGWIRLFHGEIIKDYAYQTIPDSSIHAGQRDFATQINEEATAHFILTSLNNHQLTIQLEPLLLKSEISILDVLGNMRRHFLSTDATSILDVQDFAPGIYFLQLKNNGHEWVKKIFIE